MKKVLLILSYIILIVAGVFGTLYFKAKMDGKITENESLSQTIATVQSELAAIGNMVTVYEVYDEISDTKTITMDDLKSVQIPEGSLGESSITDSSMIVGKKAKIAINPGTIITTDMLMEDGDDRGYYWVDATMPFLPINLNEGDYIDVFAQLANGEQIPVLTHKEAIKINELTVTMQLSPEELYCWNACMIDYSLFYGYGFTIYPAMYVSPGLNSTVAFYPVQKDSENMVRFDINISDYTRCVNTTLREHIDLVNSLSTTDTNSSLTTPINTLYDAMAETIKELRQARIDAEEAEKEADDDLVDLTTSGDASTDYQDTSFNDQVGDAMSDLDNAGEIDLNVIE